MSAHAVGYLERWRRYQRLAPEDRGFILRGMVLMFLTMLGLRTMSFRRFKGFIQRCSLSVASQRQIEPPSQTELQNKIIRAMNAVERNGPWRPNCLERSLALWWLFRLNAIESELRIGGRVIEGRFEAHAWVELQGRVLNESPDVHGHYARFDAPIAAAEENSH